MDFFFQPVIRIYDIPDNTFESDEDDDDDSSDDEEESESDGKTPPPTHKTVNGNY